MNPGGRVRFLSLTKDELLRQSAWFMALDEDAREWVRAGTSERVVARGASLGHFDERQRAWFGVLEGLVKWSVTSADGQTVTLGGQSVGSWFGEGTLVRNEPRQSDLIALRRSRVACVSVATFNWLREQRPVFNKFLLEQVTERLHWFMGNSVARRMLDTDSQVARALVGMVHPLLNPLEERHLHLSQEELSNLAAVSRQSCNHALKRLRDAGLIRTEYAGITVVDLEGLRAR